MLKVTLKAGKDENPYNPGVIEKAPRVASVDALRGFVMLTMLFVNDIAGVPGTPWWMEHYPTTQHHFGMTFVDVVFGAFLFIVGMAIPLSLGPRLERRERLWRVILHAILRGGGLILLGLFMMNNEVGARIPGWPPRLWGLLIYVFGIMAFLSPPRDGRARKVFIAIRVIGFLGLLYLAWVFRAGDGGRMRPEWWGILGLIGWAYLVVSFAYIPLRRSRAALVGAIGLLLAVFICDHAGGFHRLWIKNNLISDIASVLGSQPSIAMAGVVLTSIILDQTLQSRRARVGAVMIFSILCAIGAILFNPVYHISKNDATPSWCLWTCAIVPIVWLIISLLMDITGERLWVFFVVGGQNALMAYLLKPLLIHFIWFFNLKFYSHWAATFQSGFTRAVVAAIVVLGIAGLLGKIGVRLRL